MNRDNDVDIKHEWAMVGMVIDHFNQLEHTITEIITIYISPKDSRVEYFKNNLMNNSIISFGAKVKLLLGINKQEKLVKLNRDSFHRILSVRNAIAHNDIATKLKIEIPEDPYDDISTYIIMDRMKGDGSIETIPKSQAFSEFYELHMELQEDLDEMLEVSKLNNV